MPLNLLAGKRRERPSTDLLGELNKRMTTSETCLDQSKEKDFMLTMVHRAVFAAPEKKDDAIAILTMMAMSDDLRKTLFGDSAKNLNEHGIPKTNEFFWETFRTSLFNEKAFESEHLEFEDSTPLPLPLQCPAALESVDFFAAIDHVPSRSVEFSLECSSVLDPEENPGLDDYSERDFLSTDH